MPLKGQKIDSYLRYKVIVKLMEGPMTIKELKTVLKHKIGYHTFYNLLDRNLVQKVRVRGKAGYMLTAPEGLRQATEWSYKLKQLNDHPDQQVKVIGTVPSPEKEVSLPKAEEYTKEVKYTPTEIDWQREFISLAHEMARALGNNK